MGLFRCFHDRTYRTPSGYRFRIQGYRQYPPSNKSRFVDANGDNFRRLLLSLKNGNGFSIKLFAQLLAVIYDECLGGPEAVVCVPPSKETEGTRGDSIATVVRSLKILGLGVIDGSNWLRRTTSIVPCHESNLYRDAEKQAANIACVIPKRYQGVKSVLVLDDICTSGSSITGSVSRIREELPEAKITGFAFGYTPYYVESSTYATPEFPTSYGKTSDISRTMSKWLEEAWPLTGRGESPFVCCGGTVHARGCHRVDDADCINLWSKKGAGDFKKCRACRPFAALPHFVFDRVQEQLHHVSCERCPVGGARQDLWGLRHGVRLGGTLCEECMSKWQAAKAFLPIKDKE